MHVGSFYEQFGNGLIFRAWENRQLGINNSLRGIRYKFSPLKEVEILAIHGKQRFGFEYSKGAMQERITSTKNGSITSCYC